MPLVDPHTAFKNGENVDISELDIFVQLNVYKRSRLSSFNNQQGIVINFIGGSEENTFTTNWTDNNENFGIKSINMKINTSYVPQVDIVFVDIRGQSLFNDFNQSKYKLIFDFPPPIFELTLKGYYGQAVTYNLHLLRNTVKFNVGSFEISAAFVGMTFAPLADMLLDYIEVAPYLSGVKRPDPSILTTLELKISSRDLVSTIKTASAADLSQINQNNLIITELNKYIDPTTPVLGDFLKYFKKEFDNKFTNNGQLTQVQSIINNNIFTIQGLYYYNSNMYFSTDSTNSQSVLDEINNIISSINTNFSSGDVSFVIPKLPSLIKNLEKQPLSLGIKTALVKLIDIIFPVSSDNINQQIINGIQTLTNKNKAKNQETIANINNIAFNKIQGGPTLTNVMTIILNDAQTFYNELQKVVKSAETNRINETDDSTGEPRNFAFPKYFIKNGNSQILSIPQGKDSNWDEVQFINRYIDAKIQATDKDVASNLSSQVDVSGNYKYVPINSFDSVLFSSNSYLNLLKPSDIINRILSRGNVFLNETLNPKTDISLTGLIPDYAKLEAYQILQVITNTTILNTLIEAINTNIIQDIFSIGNNNIPFNSQLKNSFYQIIDASISNNVIVNQMNIFNGTYNGTTNYTIYKAVDFKGYNDIPVINQNLNTTQDDLTKKTLNIINDINSDIGKIRGKAALCQYNIPFFIDVDHADNNRNSDFYSNSHGGDLFQIKLIAGHTTNADDFLKNIILRTSDNISMVYTPFQIVKFNFIAGIFEIPFYVLVWWGFISNSLQTKPSTVSNILDTNFNGPDIGNNEQYIQYWSQIPNDLQSLFINYYQEYLTLFKSSQTKQDINTFLSTTDDSFYSTDFFKSFIEINYLILGNASTFDFTIPSKDIDYSNFKNTNSENYNLYFNTLRQELLNNKVTIINKQKDQDQNTQNIINNNNLKTELYYGFKAFVDKWMLGTPNLGLNNNGNFKDTFDINNSFLFVDRAFNLIGDKVILDLSPLYDTQTSQDTSLYTFLLNLLSKNNFEFFALPTYITPDSSGVLWSNTNINQIFGTSINYTIKSNPKFICMYIGGTSAQLDIGQIKDFDINSAINSPISHNDDGGGFDGGSADKIKDNIIIDINNSQLVNAFKVDWGTQSQSFFYDIQLDGLEYKESNESINLLDKITKEQYQGQNTQLQSNNLFNVYQQRSYSCTLSTLGNMMIQPTMYFDLMNIGMFKGAYLILEVNHSIVPNKITTSFKGVRVPKYIKPYVDSYAMIVNLGLDQALIQSNQNQISGTSNISIVKSSVINTSSAKPLLGKLQSNVVTNAYGKAFMDLIAYTEGTLGTGNNNGYDVLFGGKLIPAWNYNYKDNHQGWGNINSHGPWFITTSKGSSSASGRYQFLYSSWIGLQGGNVNFTTENQDTRAYTKITERLNNKFIKRLPKSLPLDNTISASNFVNYIDKLSPEWDSLPYSTSESFYVGGKTHQTTAGLSYAGKPVPQRSQSLGDLYDIWNSALQKYIST